MDAPKQMLYDSRNIGGYMIKKNRKKIIEEFSEASNIPLEHMFINNENFSAEVCFKTRASK